MPGRSLWMSHAPQGIKGFDDDDDDLSVSLYNMQVRTSRSRLRINGLCQYEYIF